MESAAIRHKKTSRNESEGFFICVGIELESEIHS